METLNKSKNQTSDCKPTKEQQQPKEGKSSDVIDLTQEEELMQASPKSGKGTENVENDDSSDVSSMGSDSEIPRAEKVSVQSGSRLSGSARRRFKMLLEEAVPRKAAAEKVEHNAKKSVPSKAAIQAKPSEKPPPMNEKSTKKLKNLLVQKVPGQTARIVACDPAGKIGFKAALELAIELKSTVGPNFEAELDELRPYNTETEKKKMAMNAEEKRYVGYLVNGCSPDIARLKAMRLCGAARKRRRQFIEEGYEYHIACALALITSATRANITQNVSERFPKKKSFERNTKNNNNPTPYYFQRPGYNPPAPNRYTYIPPANTPINQSPDFQIDTETFCGHQKKWQKKIGVVPFDFPVTLWNMEQLEAVQTAVLERTFDQKEGAIKPQFQGTAFHEGWLSFTCSKEATVTWLKRLVPSLKLWRGASVKLVEQIICVGYFPASSEVSTENILTILEAQNSGLDVGEWRILNRAERDGEVRLIIAIDISSAAKMNNGRLELGYGFGSVFLQLQSSMSKSEADSLNNAPNLNFQRAPDYSSRNNGDLYDPGQPTQSNDDFDPHYRPDRRDYSRSSNRNEPSSYGRMSNYNASIPPLIDPNQRDQRNIFEARMSNNNDHFRTRNESNEPFLNGRMNNTNVPIPPLLNPNRNRQQNGELSQNLMNNTRPSISSLNDLIDNTPFSLSQLDRFRNRNESNETSSYGQRNNTNASIPPLISPNPNDSFALAQRKLASLVNGPASNNRQANSMGSFAPRLNPSSFQNKAASFDNAKNFDGSFGGGLNLKESSFFNQQNFRPTFPNTQERGGNQANFYNESNNSNSTFSSTQAKRAKFQNEIFSNDRFGNTNPSIPPLMNPNQRDRTSFQSKANEGPFNGRMSNNSMSISASFDPSQRERSGSRNEGRNAMWKAEQMNQWVVGYDNPKRNNR